MNVASHVNARVETKICLNRACSTSVCVSCQSMYDWHALSKYREVPIKFTRMLNVWICFVLLLDLIAHRSQGQVLASCWFAKRTQLSSGFVMQVSVNNSCTCMSETNMQMCNIQSPLFLSSVIHGSCTASVHHTHFCLWIFFADKGNWCLVLQI